MASQGDGGAVRLDQATGFLRYYTGALGHLCASPGPLIAAAVYCFVLVFPVYRGASFQPRFPGEAFRPLAQEAMDGLWYLLAPAMAIGLLWAVTRVVPGAKRRCPRHRFRNFGWRWGTRAAWRDALILYLLALPFVAAAAFLKDFARTYPLCRIGGKTVLCLVAWEAVCLLYMFGWEFLHRGWLLFGLEEKLGRWAVLATAVPFTLLHTGKPELEAYASFVAGMALGWLALRSRSFLPAALLHWAVAFTLDVLLVISGGGFE